MSKKRRMPFGWAPSHWGLKGKLREVAKAEYELDGEELERELLRINALGRTEEEVMKASLVLDKKYGKLTEEQYDHKLLDLRAEELDEKELKLEKLKLDKKYGKVNEDEYKKQRATILDEPYVRFTEIQTDPSNPSIGAIALDYNQAFIAYLEEHGYGPAPNPEQIVDEWFTELCKNIALESFDGVGDFNEQMNEKDQRNPDIIYQRDLKKPKDKK